MRKHWIFVGALLALGVAMVAVPAWGDAQDGGGAQVERAPLPAPHAGPLGLVGPAGMAEARRAREHLDELTDCIEAHGADVPALGEDPRQIELPPAAADRALRRAARQCGVPAPPTRGDFPGRAVLDARRAHFEDRVLECMPGPPRRQG